MTHELVQQNYISDLLKALNLDNKRMGDGGMALSLKGYIEIVIKTVGKISRNVLL
jgi:hypothetical protein